MSNVVRANVKSIFGWPPMSEGGHELPTFELESWAPIDPDRFAVSVMVFVAQVGDERPDSFDVVVCSPRWLADNFDHPRIREERLSEAVLPGRSLILMATWDYQAFRAAIEGFVSGQQATSWPDLANRIGRILPWEFDYLYDRRQDNG